MAMVKRWQGKMQAQYFAVKTPLVPLTLLDDGESNIWLMRYSEC